MVRIRVGRLSVAAVVILAGLSFTPQAGAATTFAKGDVFVSVSNGQVQWRQPDGTLVTTLDDGQGGFTTGMAFDKSSNLYVTNFSGGFIDRYNASGTLLGTFGPGGFSSPESVVFDITGNAYIGQASSSEIVKLDPNGIVLDTDAVAIERRGTDWIDLAADQCTIFYTSEGSSILRFNGCTDTQQPSFATGLPGGAAFALRILPDGGVLVADSVSIFRLNASGSIIKTYDVPGEDAWFALNLDPDGTSFWSADFNTANVYRFDIASGSVLKTFNTGTGPSTVFGLAVNGEITAARDTTPPSCRLTARRPGPPVQIDLTVQDSGTGLASVLATNKQNVTVAIPSFAVGTTNPLVVKATKVNQALQSRFTLTARDVAGNVTRCTASGVISF